MNNKKTVLGIELQDGIKRPLQDGIINLFDAYEPDKFYFSLNESMLSRHTLILGGAGSGKTNVFNLMFSQLLSRRNSNDVFIVFDTKGDFYNNFGRESDIVLGNGKEYRKLSERWNLFDEVLADGMNPEDYEMNAREIAAGLFVGRGSESQPFFSNAARDIFAHLIIYFIRQVEKNPALGREQLTNKHLVSYIQKADVSKYIRVFSSYSDMRGMLSYFGDGSSNQALGVFAELKNMLYDCFLGVFADDDSQGRFSMRNTVKNKGGNTVFVEYDLTTGETMTPIYRLLIDLALQEALGRGDKEEGNVYLILDELKLLPKLQHLDDALNFGRSKGVKVIAGIQSINQLFDIYGDAKGHVLAGGFSNLFAFHTSDNASRQYVSEVFGNNVIGYEYTGIDKSIEIREREGYAVETWDQMRLKTGEAIIGLSDVEVPFFFKFQEYRGN